MQVDVVLKNSKLLDNRLAGSTVIVIDVLRATSAIIWAVRNGASQVIPTKEPGEATDIAGRLGIKDCVLAGERGGIRISGFQLGNSPLEFTEDVVKNKSVVISTTNGTNTITNVRNASTLLIGAIINRTAVAKKAVESGGDIIIVCSGTDGNVSADDMCAAGSILAVLKTLLPEDTFYTDSALVCERLFEDHINGTFDIADIYHYKRLKKLGFVDDLKFCFELDKTDVVPYYSNGIIKG